MPRVECLGFRTEINEDARWDTMATFRTRIYNAGLSGTLPAFPVDFATLERRAESAMTPSLLNYVQGGCGDEHTQRANSAAFHRWGMVPRMY